MPKRIVSGAVLLGVGLIVFNRVDEEAFRMLVEAQIAAGVAGIVAVGLFPANKS